MSMKPLLVTILCLYSFLSQAQEEYYYVFSEDHKIYLQTVPGKYVVEYQNWTTSTPNPNPYALTKLAGNYYLVTDFNIVDDYDSVYKIWPVYQTNNETEVYVCSEIVLMFKEETSGTEIEELLENYNLELLDSTNISWLFRTTNANVIETCREIFETNLVKFCTPNFISEPAQNLTNDTYFNKQFYLHNEGQIINDNLHGTADADIDAPEAWTITKGNGSVKVAIIDAGIPSNHPDLPSSRIIVTSGANVTPHIGTNTNPNDPSPTDNMNIYHGIACAGIIGATHDNEGIAGICPECKIVPLRMTSAEEWIAAGQPFYSATFYEKAIRIAADNEAKIISCSWGWPNKDPFHHAHIANSILYASSKGYLSFFAAGNLETPTNDTGKGVFFPANTKVRGLITVGASDRNDMKATYSPKSGYIDIVAPSHTSYNNIDNTEAFNVWTTDNIDTFGANKWHKIDTVTIPAWGEELPNYGTNNLAYSGRFGGTSAAAPQVAGVAALMLSINPCLKVNAVRDILFSTADKVGGYNYSWDPLRQGHSLEMGYGRLNAYQAVKAAQDFNKNTLDLYIKDEPTDLGTGRTTGTDNSPDIWVRAYDDNIEKHEAPEYYIDTSTVFIKIKIRNKSCVSATNGQAKLSVYWSKASTLNSWPKNWNGSQPTVGNKIATVNVPSISAGDDRVVTIPWLIDPSYYQPGDAVCLLARIEDCSADPIANYWIDPGNHSKGTHLGLDVGKNNNISLKNLEIVDMKRNVRKKAWPGAPLGGNYVKIGNPADGTMAYDFTLKVPHLYNGVDITEKAEIKVIFDQGSWNAFMNAAAFEQEGVKIFGSNAIIITQPEITFSNVVLPADSIMDIYIGFNFLVDSMTNDTVDYEYTINQALSSDPDTPLGSMNFIVRKYAREPFNAYAGPDDEIDKGQSFTLTASDIEEDAIYNWYDSLGNLLDTNRIFTYTPDVTQKYILEVVARADGFIDYDEVKVVVKPYFINSVSPNPAQDNVTIEYETTGAASAFIWITPASGGASISYPISTGLLNTNIDISGFPIGNYVISLVCDNFVVDAANLVIN